MHCFCANISTDRVGTFAARVGTVVDHSSAYAACVGTGMVNKITDSASVCIGYASNQVVSAASGGVAFALALVTFATPRVARTQTWSYVMRSKLFSC